VCVLMAVIIPEWELLLCNLVSKITRRDCAGINRLRNLLNQTSFSTQEKPSFKNSTSHKACATRPKTPTTKQQGEMCNINQMNGEISYSGIQETEIWGDFLPAFKKRPREVMIFCS